MASTVSDDTADKLAIRSLIESYCDAIMRHDIKTWGATWANESVWHHLGRDFVGKPAIVDAFREAMQDYEFIVHFEMAGPIELQAEQATGRWYVNEFQQSEARGAARLIGVCDDKYRRIDGRWRITYRRFNLLYQGNVDMTDGEFLTFVADSS